MHVIRKTSMGCLCFAMNMTAIALQRVVKVSIARDAARVASFKTIFQSIVRWQLTLCARVCGRYHKGMCSCVYDRALEVNTISTGQGPACDAVYLVWHCVLLPASTACGSPATHRLMLVSDQKDRAVFLVGSGYLDEGWYYRPMT